MKTRKPKAGEVPNYLEEVAKLTATARPGTITHVVVEHEPDCPLLAHRGPCNCSATVREVKPS